MKAAQETNYNRLMVVVAALALVLMLVVAYMSEQDSNQAAAEACTSICAGQNLAYHSARMGSTRLNGVCYCTDSSSNLHTFILN